MPDIELDKELLLRYIEQVHGKNRRRDYEENRASLEDLRMKIEEALNKLDPKDPEMLRPDNPKDLNTTLYGLVNINSSPQASIQTGGIQAVVQVVPPSLDAQGYQQSQNPNQGSESLYSNVVQEFNSPFKLKLVPGSQLKNEEKEKKEMEDKQYKVPRPDDKLREPWKV